MSLIAELQRRLVFRALVGYGIAAFAVLQIIEPVMHGLHWPDAVLTYVVVALAIGFPIVVSLAWIFDVNRGRIERTAPVAGQGGARLALMLVGIGLLAAAPGSIWYLYVHRAHESTGHLVVRDEGEERRPARHRRVDAANLLEGSVRKSGPRVRITAQLIEAQRGSHLWSQEFDLHLTDVFAAQDQIAKAVVAALKLKLLPSTAIAEPRTSRPAFPGARIGGRIRPRGAVAGESSCT